MNRSSESQDNADVIRPIRFSPSEVLAAESKTGRRVFPLIILLLLVILAILAWYLFTARSVLLQIEPDAKHVSISGGLPSLHVGGRYLIHSGDHKLTATRPGYYDLQQAFNVSDAADQSLKFSMRKLPGYVSITSRPASQAQVMIDGKATGMTPLKDLELQPGMYQVKVIAERYQPFIKDVEVEGEGEKLTIGSELLPAWAEVKLSSEPSGVEIQVDGMAVGMTPMTAEILEGSREVSLHQPGYKVWQRELQITANAPQELPTVTMQKADGKVAVHSTPEGASITVNGEYRGRTPAEILLPPGAAYLVSLSKAGYSPTERSLDVSSGGESDIRMTLQPLVGEVHVTSSIKGAELLVDGVSKGDADDQTLSLSAVAHKLEVRKAGYASYQTTVTPQPGFTQELSADLKTQEETEKASPVSAPAGQVNVANGHTLRLIKPGVFTMGASRREQGRRANESLRSVKLTRAFYIATQEVTNQQFRKLKVGHSSGQAQSVSLDKDDYPVVNVSWQDAANYCNWLSKQESLPPAYIEKAGKLVAAEPLTTGYRLPTEAEWAWVARYEAGTTARKYPWGDALPLPEKSGNYADRSAASLIANNIDSYTDGYAATSPVGAFKPNSLGLYDLGGNVAEWVHDYYAVYPEAAGQTFTDPTGPATGSFHVIRGSSWQQASISELRLSYRDYGDKSRPDVGFRISRYAQ